MLEYAAGDVVVLVVAATLVAAVHVALTEFGTAGGMLPGLGGAGIPLLAMTMQEKPVTRPTRVLCWQGLGANMEPGMVRLEEGRVVPQLGARGTAVTDCP